MRPERAPRASEQDRNDRAQRGSQRSWATSAPFRVAVAVLCLAFHLLAFKTIAADRMGLPWNRAPSTPPAFDYPDQPAPSEWNRLIVSRWDSQHYIDILERGFEQCPPEDLRGASLNPYTLRCGFNFYPGYALVGRAVKAVTHLPADYALLAVALGASFLFLFWWTGPALTSALGVKTTYVSLLLFNVFTTGFALTTVQTEPLALAVLLGAFVCLRRRWWLLGAAVAGFGGAIRVAGPAVGAAYGIALFANALVDARERPLVRWGRLVVAAPLCAWGQLAILAFFHLKYKDALLYFKSHSQAYGHSVSLAHTVLPEPATVARSLLGLHEGLFIVLGLMWLALGMRRALSGFPIVERVYWYAITIVLLSLGLLGSAGLAYAGMNRYWLSILPMFFSMAVVLRERRLALAVWSAFSLWHYWNVDLCVFVAQWDAVHYCNMSFVP